MEYAAPQICDWAVPFRREIHPRPSGGVGGAGSFHIGRKLTVLCWRPLAAAQRPSAEEHSMGRFRPLWTWDGTLQRIHHALLCDGTRAGGTGGDPDHGNHRQPDLKGAKKGGPCLTRRASMRARRSWARINSSSPYSHCAAETFPFGRLLFPERLLRQRYSSRQFGLS